LYLLYLNFINERFVEIYFLSCQYLHCILDFAFFVHHRKYLLTAGPGEVVRLGQCAIMLPVLSSLPPLAVLLFSLAFCLMVT
jgi:hypothetical protein